MIDLTDHKAIRLERWPVDLRHVRVLDDFDGPLLTESVSTLGDSYVHHWCDCEGSTERWLVVRVTPAEILRYALGLQSLKDLLASSDDPSALVVDLVDRDAEVWLLPRLGVPDDYLPSGHVHRQRGVPLTPDRQEVYLNGQWDSEDLSRYFRNYLSAYWFAAAFGEHGRPAGLRLDYDVAGSNFTTRLVNQRLRQLTPQSRKARLGRVAMASPGVLHFTVDTQVAADLLLSLQIATGSRDDLKEIRSELRAWKSRATSEDEDKRLEADAQKDEATELLRRGCESTGVNHGALIERSLNLATAVHVFQGFCNRLDFLERCDTDEEAMLVGLSGG